MSQKEMGYFLYIGYAYFFSSIEGVDKSRIYKIGISHNPKTRVYAVLGLIPFNNKTVAFRYEHALHIHLSYHALGNEFFELPDSQVEALLKCRDESDLREFLQIADCDGNPVEIVARRMNYNHYQNGSYSHHIPRHPRFLSNE